MNQKGIEYRVWKESFDPCIFVLVKTGAVSDRNHNIGAFKVIFM